MYKIVQRKERSADGTAKTVGEPNVSPTISPVGITATAVAPPIRIAKAPHRTSADAPTIVPQAVPTAIANTADGLSSAAINAIRTEISKSGGTAPTGEKQSAKDATAGMTEKAKMDASVRLIDDEMELIDALKEFLVESNTKYSVIGALGAQGTGKSTVLSMLAGNNPADMYRQYVFRPAAREAVEACRYQTTKISVYVVPKLRTFFLDCQPLNCAPLLEDFCRARRVKGAEALDAIELESLHLLLLLSSVCHTVVLCIDWFIDLGIVRRLMRTELFFPLIFPHNDLGRVNLVVLHQRAKPTDLEPLLVHQRMRLLNAIFEASSFNINGGLTMAKLGFNIYEPICAALNVNYILLGELKPRTRMDELEQHMKHQDDYVTTVTKLRHKIYQLPTSRSTFGEKTEAQWFSGLTESWKRIRDELPKLTEDGCTIKRQRGTGGQSQSNLFVAFKSSAHPSSTATVSHTPTSVFLLKQRTVPQGNEYARGRPRGKGRRGGNWDNSVGSARGEEVLKAFETTEEIEGSEPNTDRQRKTTTDERERQQHQKKRVWRTRKKKTKDVASRQKANEEEGPSTSHSSARQHANKEQQLDQSGRSETPANHGDEKECDQQQQQE